MSLMVRDVFVARPGMASKLAKLLHDAWAAEGMQVWTDLVSEFNTVVMQSEVQDLAEFERRWQDYMAEPKYRERMKGYTDMYQTGRREILRRVG